MSYSACGRLLASLSFCNRSQRVVCRPPLSSTRFAHPQAVRLFSFTPASALKSFNYETLRPYTQSLPEHTVLIDVREADEYAEGHIPHAINIPIKSKPEALLMPPEEFEEHFGFAKPSTDAETIFYCRAGVRSRAASQIAERAGYSKVGDYTGSWLDWTAKGGRIVR